MSEKVIKEVAKPDCCGNCENLRWGETEGWDKCAVDGVGIGWNIKGQQVCDKHKRSSKLDPRVESLIDKVRSCDAQCSEPSLLPGDIIKVRNCNELCVICTAYFSSPNNTLGPRYVYVRILETSRQIACYSNLDIVDVVMLGAAHFYRSTPAFPKRKPPKE